MTDAAGVPRKRCASERELSGELPLVAALTNGVWIVKCTLPKGWVGGVGVVKISKGDGRILEVRHYK